MKPLPSVFRNKRGVALLMTLGVLSILTVMTLSFALTALHSQSMAKLGENVVKARLLAETGFQRMYQTLSIDLADPNDRRNLFPETKLGVVGKFGTGTQSGPWNGRIYWASMSSDTSGIREALHVQIAGEDYTPDPSNAMLHSTVGWLHETDPGGSGAIIGRYCYLVVGESGKIEPTSATHNTIQENTNAETNARVGNSVSDINLVHVVGNNFAKRFQREGLGPGNRPTDKRWFSYHYIFRQHSTAQNNHNTIFKQRIFPHGYDIEAFNDGAVDKHRFDLANADWDGFNNSVASSGIDADASDFWKGSAFETNSGGIPWFHFCSDTTLKSQVIANLIDYSDSDTVATADSAINPTYVGNEKIPYINEMLFRGRIFWHNGTSQYRFQLRVWPEVINLWDTALGAGKMEIKVEVESVDLPTNPTTLTFNWNNVSDTDPTSYRQLVQRSKIVNLGATQDELRNVKLTVTQAKYTSHTGDLWDFAKTDKSVSTYLDTTQNRFIAVQCNDPRNNLATTEWHWPSPATGWSNAVTGTSSPAAINDVVTMNPGSAGDVESTATEPWEVSTVFHRDGPIANLWELGCIHRGGSWQTINLTTFNNNAINTTGMADYTLGDANILGQVKMTSGVTPETYGKVNINTRWIYALRGLLSRLSYGNTYAAPTGSGTNITNAMINTFRGTGSLGPGEWFFENGVASVIRPFPNRGAIARVTLLSDGSVIPQTTDMAKEEIIGKIANITTVRPNYFIVIVTAQAIKDLPTGILGGTKGTFDVNVDKILAEQKLMVTMYRDGFTNEFKVLRYEYVVD